MRLMNLKRVKRLTSVMRVMSLTGISKNATHASNSPSSKTCDFIGTHHNTPSAPINPTEYHRFLPYHEAYISRRIP
jgi:hypothetical protein